MKQLQNFGIQAKFIAIFTIVFLAGILATGWTTYMIRQTRNNIQETLDKNRKAVTDIAVASRQDVSQVLDKADELVYLQRLYQGFHELEAIEKDYVLAADPNDELGLIAAHDTMSGWLEEDLATAQEYATDDEVAQMITNLQDELKQQKVLFDELVDMVDTDPQAAQQRSLAASTERADHIYNPLSSLVNDRWDIAVNEVSSAREQMADAIVRVDEQAQDAASDTDSQLQKTITISLLTIGLFVIAGGVIAGAVYVVSRQIVQPVLQMSDVAVAIEKEEYKSAESLDSLADRKDEIGQLARVFNRMAKEVFARVERLKQQVAELRIAIDQKKVDEQVSEITDSEYFQDLQSRVQLLRQRDRQRRSGLSSTEGESSA